MYQMSHDISFKNLQGKEFKLKLLHAVEVRTSIENLVDTATITLPELVMNEVLSLEDKLPRGTEVNISLGYDDNLNHEFSGFITEINNNNGTLNIECEDALFLFRKKVADKQFKPAKVEDILKYLISQIDPSFTLVMDVDYGVTYEKFTIYQAEAYDVLKKLQEELSANIYFDTEKKELHFHAPYEKEQGKVTYNLAKNVENSSLEYKKAENRKVEIILEVTGKDGEIIQKTFGTPGGEQEKRKVGAMSAADLKKIGENMIKQFSADKYEGSIDTWLIPFVRPSYRAKFIDDDYPERNGSYYVTGVTTSFSDGGGKRNVKFGIRLN